MGSHLAERIVTPVLALKVHAGHARLLHLARKPRRHLTLQIHELPLAPLREQALELPEIEAQQCCELAPATRLGGQLAGICPHRVHRRADRQWLTVPIENFSTVGGNHLDAQMAGVALANQKVLVGVLQIHRAPQ